jgi:hypothetical protein
VKGGFYFHPTDEDLSAGTPVRKKPLSMVLSVYINSENAIPGIQFLRRCSLPACAVIKAENANSLSTLDWDKVSHPGLLQITRMTI